jgi:hypothetical protein
MSDKVYIVIYERTGFIKIIHVFDNYENANTWKNIANGKSFRGFIVEELPVEKDSCLNELR